MAQDPHFHNIRASSTPLYHQPLFTGKEGPKVPSPSGSVQPMQANQPEYRSYMARMGHKDQPLCESLLVGLAGVRMEFARVLKKTGQTASTSFFEMGNLR